MRILALGLAECGVCTNHQLNNNVSYVIIFHIPIIPNFSQLYPSHLTYPLHPLHPTSPFLPKTPNLPIVPNGSLIETQHPKKGALIAA